MSAAEKLRLAAAKHRHRQLELAWRHSILGMLEVRVRRLACCYNVYGFNAEVGSSTLPFQFDSLSLASVFFFFIPLARVLTWSYWAASL